MENTIVTESQLPELPSTTEQVVDNNEDVLKHDEQESNNDSFANDNPLLHEDENNSRNKYVATRAQRDTVNQAAHQAIQESETIEKNNKRAALQDEVVPNAEWTPFEYNPDLSPLENARREAVKFSQKKELEIRKDFLTLYGNNPTYKYLTSNMKFEEKAGQVKDLYDVKVNNQINGTTDGLMTVDKPGPLTVSVNGHNFQLGSLGMIVKGENTEEQKKEDIKAVAERLHIAPYQVTDKHLEAFYDWQKTEFIKMAQTGTQANFEMFDYDKADQYKQFIAENGKDIAVKFREIPDLQNLDRRRMQILSKDGKVNLSDTYFLNPYLNLQWDIKTKELYYYADAYIQGLLPAPKLFLNTRSADWFETVKIAGNSIFDSLAHWADNIKALKFRYIDGDENKVADILRERALNPSVKFFHIPEEVELHRQIQMQRIIDQGNADHGVWNSISTWLRAFVDAPAVATAESMGEMGQIAAAGALSAALAKTLNMSKYGKLATTFIGLMLGAGLEETINAESDYYVKHGKAMPNDLFLGSWALNSAVLGLELPALTRLGAGCRRLVGLPGTISTKGIKGAFGGLGKDFSGFLYAIANEGVTEPLQNATFQAWLELKSLSEIGLYPRAWLRQWEGTNWGQRLYESGSAAGSAGFLGAFGTVQSIAGTTKQGIQTNIKEKRDATHSGDKQLNEDEIKVSTNDTDGYINDIKTKQAEIEKAAQDPNTDMATFVDTVNSFIAKLDLLGILRERNETSQGTSYSDADRQRMEDTIGRGKKDVIGYAIAYAKSHGIDMKQMCDILYNQLIAGNPHDAPIDSNIDTVQEIFQMYEKAVLFSFSGKRDADDTSTYIDIDLSDDPDTPSKITVKEDDYLALKSFYEEMQRLGHIPQDMTFEERLFQDFKLDTFGIDLFSNGYQSNSIMQYRKRISEYILYLTTAKNGIKAALIAINQILPEDEKLTLKQLLNMSADDFAILKDAYPEIAKELTGLETLIPSYIDSSGKLLSQIKLLYRFIHAREEKFEGFINAIKAKFGDGNTHGKVVYQYVIKKDSSDPITITLTFNGSTLLYSDLNSDEVVRDEQGRISHPDQVLLRKMYKENLLLEQQISELLNDIHDVIDSEMVDKWNDMVDDPRDVHDMDFGRDAEAGKSFIEGLWSDLLQVQQTAKTGRSKPILNKQILSAFKTAVTPILAACVAKLLKEGNIAGIAAQMAMALTNDSWLDKAQVRNRKNLLSPARTQSFLFQQLYAMMTPELREQFKQALNDALSQLIPMTELRFDNDPSLASYSEELRDEFIALGPYKDRTANLLYNLKLQIEAVEASEAAKQTEATNEVNEENVQEVKNTPEMRFQEIYNGLIQQGRFYEAGQLNDNKEDVLKQIADNENVDIESLVRQYVPKGLRVKVDGNMQSQDIVLTEYEVQETGFPKVLQKIIDFVAKGENVTEEDQKLVYWAKRAILNKNDENVFHRAGYAMAMLFKNLSDPNFAKGSIVKKLLQKYFKNELASYEKTRVVKKYVKDENGKKKLVTFDYSLSRERTATWDNANHEFRLNQETVYFYGQKVNTDYTDTTAETILTPTVTYNGKTYYPSHKIFVAQSKDSQQTEKTVRVSEIDKANDILDALCKKISKDGVVSYSAGFLQEAKTPKEYVGKTIQEKLTRFQDYLAVLIKYVQDGGKDPEVLAVLEGIKAGYMEIDGLRIPVPSVDVNTIPQRDSVLTAEQVMELRKTYFIRQYTGTTENPLLNTIIPGQKYKVYAVTGVPVNDLVSKSDDTTADSILAGDFSVKPGTPTVKGEIIIVPANSDGTGILTNYKPAQDSEMRSRTRNSSQANALNGPSVFLLQNSKQERNRKLGKKDISFLNKKIMAGVSGTGIRAIFSILTNIGNVCRNKDGSDCIELANIIRTVNDYSSVSPELGMVLTFLHELNNRIEALSISYSMYFVGHNRNNVKGWELEAILRQIDNPIEYLQGVILGNNEEVSRSVYQNVFNVDLATLYTKSIFDQNGDKRKGYRADNSWFITNRLLRDFFIFYYQEGNTLSNADFQKEYAHMEINPNDLFVETDDVETLDVDTKGKRFEEIAQERIKAKGWEIVDTNKREGNAEIDIVAKDENGKIHFIEVRYRGLEETAKSSIDDKKASAMIKAAEAYAKREGLTSNDYSIDLLSVDKKSDNTAECTLTENYVLTNEQQNVQYSANFDEVSDEEYEQRLAEEDISRDPEVNLGTMKVVPFSESGKNKFKSGVYVLAVNNEVSDEQQTLLSKITSYLSEQGLIARTNDFFYETNANDNIPAENRETITADELAANNKNDNGLAEAIIDVNIKNPGKPESNVRAGKLLMGRNLKVPLDFVIYDQEEDTWVKGALREVIRMAKKLNLPIFNIRAKNFLKQFKNFIRRYIASKGDKQPLISKDPNLLEVSTKDKLGKVFSAMNMRIIIGGQNFCVESVYQASKSNNAEERDKVAHMNGFQAKQYNKDDWETLTYGDIDTGIFAGKEMNLSELYFGLYTTSLAQMLRNEGFKQLLINVFKNYDGYKDTFRGFKTVNSQADVMNFLRAKYYLLGEDAFFEQLKEYANPDNITNGTEWAEEFVGNVENRSGNNINVTREIMANVFDDLSLEDDTEQYMKTLFNELYRGNGFVNESHLWLMRPILEMRDNADRKHLGWSTVVSALIGDKKGTSTYEKLINGGYASTSFILENGTTPVKDKNTHMHVAKEGFLLSRLQAAFNGTVDFDTHAMLVGTDVLVVVDKNHNVDLIVQSEKNVRATDLLAAILLTRFITSNSKEYNMMRRTVNSMIADPTIDKTIDLTTNQDAVLDLVITPDLTIDKAIDVLGLAAEYTETQNSIKQKDESAKQAQKQAVINNDNISEEENNSLIAKEIAQSEDGNTSSLIKAYQRIQTSRFGLSQELIDKKQELLDTVQNTPIEEREFYIKKYQNNLRNMLEDSETVDEKSKLTLKQLSREMTRNDLSDYLEGRGVDLKTVPTDKEGIYNGVDSVTIVEKYVENAIKDAAIWNEFLNKIASFRDIPPLPDNIEKETQAIVNKSLPNLMEMTIFDTNLQNISDRDGNIKNLKELSLEEQQEYIANLIQRCPAIQLMYDFSIKDGKIVATVNPVIARALYQVTLQELLEYRNTTTHLSDGTIAKLEGMTEEQLKSSDNYDEIVDFYNKNGVPFVTYLLTLGRKVVNKLGLSINKLENDRYSLSDEIAYQLGIAVWNIIEELNTQEVGAIDDVERQAFMQGFLGSFQDKEMNNVPYSDMYNILLHNSRAILEELKDLGKTGQRKALIAFYQTVNQSKEKGRLRLPKPLYIRSNENGQYIKVLGYPKADKHEDKRIALQELDKNNPIDESVHGLSRSPIKKVDTVNDSDAKIRLTDAQQKALQILQTTPNHIDPIAMDICNKYSNFLFKHEGGRFPGDDARLTAKERLSNKNNSLNRATAILQCLYNLIKDGAFYIKYAVTKTMRFGCKGTVNPQSDKMHRWITYPGEMTTLSINGLTQKSKRDMKYEAWALAQAFDMVGSQKKIQQCYDILMDICKKDDLDTFEQDLCTLTPKQFESKYGLGIENIYQCIAAVAHLRRRVEAMKQGANDFKTNLRAELDSTTSGYFIKIMTLLDAKLIKKFGPKVGIFTDISKIITAIETGKFITDYETMSELKKAINDIYRQVAIEMSKNDRRAVKATWDNIQNLDESYHINELFPNRQAFEEFVDTFPSAQQTIEGDWVVDSDLRELLKGIVMVYGYSAGESTLERKLSEAFYFKYYDAANEVMRDFEDSIDNKENPTLEDFQQYYDNWKNKDKFLLNFFHLTFFYLDIFRRTERSTYKDLSLYLLKQLKESSLEIVTEDRALQEFITYYKFFKMQVKGMIQHGEVIDIYPSMMIISKNYLPNQVTITHSVESHICDILDNSLGNAMIKGMGEFGAISHSNMVMSTISSILNFAAQQDFNARKAALYRAKGENWYSEMTNAEYKELLYPEQRITANIPNLFSMMQPSMLSDDEITNRYGLSVVGLKKVPKYRSNLKYFAIEIQRAKPGNRRGNQSQDFLSTRALPEQSFEYSEDIGLELTAATTQSSDAALLTSTLVALYEQGIDGTFIHDAMVLPFNRLDTGNFLYSHFSALFFSRYNMLLSYIYEGLKTLVRLDRKAVEEGLSEKGLYEYGKDNVDLMDSNVLTTLSKLNLHNVFGYPKDSVYSKSKLTLPNDETGHIYTIAKLVRIFKVLAEMSRINFQKFYVNEANTTINNMDGYRDESKSYTIKEGEQDILGKYEESGAIESNVYYQDFNKDIPAYEELLEGAITRNTIRRELNDRLQEKATPHTKEAIEPQEEVIEQSTPVRQEEVIEQSTPVRQEQGKLFSFGLPNFQSESGWTEVLSRANTLDSKAIMAVLDKLPKSIKDDPVAIATFKNFLSQLDLSQLVGWSIQVGTTKDITQGATDPTTKTIWILVNDKDTSVMNPSPATVYMHEVMHAILNYAFTERKNNPAINALIEKMRAIQEEASKMISWKDFLDDPAHATKEQIKMAMGLWNYCFANKNPNDPDAGLKEFLSYASSDPTFIRILKSRKIGKTKVSFWQRIVNCLKALFDIITLRRSVTDTAKQNGWFINNNLDDYAGKDMYEAMQQLALDIQYANADAEHHFNIATKAIYGFYGLVDTLRTCGNKYLTRFTRNLFNAFKPKYINMNSTLGVAKSLAMLPFSAQARRQWYDIVSGTTRILHQTDVRLLLDDFGSIDKQRAKFDELSRNSRAIEAYYQNVRSVTMEGLVKAFGRDLTQEESNAVTDIVMCTDLQCLFDGNNIDDIMKILTDKAYRDRLIASTRTSDLALDNMVLSDETNAKINKAIDTITTRWAYVLYYGKGDNLIGTTDNATHIVSYMRSTIRELVEQEFPQNSKDVQGKMTEEILGAMKEKIDKLTTLKALDITQKKDPSRFDLIRDLDKHGIEVFLQEHKTYVDKVKEQNSFNEQVKERGKGFSMSRYNHNMECVIAPVSEKSKMEFNGYTMIDNVHDGKNIYTEQGSHMVGEKMGIFIKQKRYIDSRSNSALTFIATKWAGKDLESYFEEAVSLDDALKQKIVQEVENNKLVLEDQKEAIINAKSRNEKSQQRETLLDAYIKRQIRMAFDINSQITEQQIENEILDTGFDGRSYQPMTRQEQVEKLKLSRNCFDIMSRMVATQVAYNEGERQNIAILQLLDKFARNNMNPLTHRDYMTGKKYINVAKRLRTELHMGKIMQKGKLEDEVWVREDMVEKLFGQTSTNISQKKHTLGPKKGYSIYRPAVRGAFEIFELILKMLAYKDKETIVMRKPAVIIGNIVSNLSYNTLSEPNLKKVIDMNKANIANTNNYLQAHREYISLELEKRRLGDKFSHEKEARMIRLKNQMDNNPIAPLFESGMFTSIIEDVPLKDKEAVTSYLDMLSKSKLVRQTPGLLKVVLRHLYMTEGTPIFDAFYNMNKYSDFVARATEYQIQMEKHAEEIRKDPSKYKAIQEEVLKDVWNAFIDYDRPNGKVEQYLNDIGVLMFTKYAKGIQRVICKQMIDNPMGAIFFLSRELVVPIDISNIFEGNAVSKKWGMLVHNPVSNLVDVLTPPLFRVTGVM